ncbi:MAG: rhomboid family intramembrane serine protease [Acidobacteriia bacterium]|nr:rhomboid family intramembrane serine protease [Terriglobia bacterium]
MNSSRFQTRTISFGGPLSRGVKGLIVANIAAFALRFFVQNMGGIPFDGMLGLVPALITTRFFVWQFVTYLFVHAGPLHLLFNMLVLWMFGCDLERLWGLKKFLRYYFLSGVGAGLCSYLVGPLSSVPTVGASGAIYGLLLAYGVLFADRVIYLYFLFPIKAKYFVLIMGALEFYAAIATSGSGVSHTAHLGGMAFGYLYLRRGRWSLGWGEMWARWKLQRARRKFKIYLSEVEKEKRAEQDDRPDKKTMIQ